MLLNPHIIPGACVAQVALRGVEVSSDFQWTADGRKLIFVSSSALDETRENKEMPQSTLGRNGHFRKLNMGMTWVIPISLTAMGVSKSPSGKEVDEERCFH